MYSDSHVLTFLRESYIDKTFQTMSYVHFQIEHVRNPKIVLENSKYLAPSLLARSSEKEE